MNNNLKFSKWLIPAGIALVAMSALLLLLIFYPAIKTELKYQFSEKGKDAEVFLVKGSSDSRNDGKDVINPIDENFGIVIPKISANARVIENVDPYGSKEYQKKLTLGVAHAKGTALPGEGKNIFIFSHSGIDFYEANRYNAIFYLLGKMEEGDDIYLFFQGKKFRYKVKTKEIVGADQVEYLKKESNEETLTLMTCWPAGTTFKRLVVTSRYSD